MADVVPGVSRASSVAGAPENPPTPDCVVEMLAVPAAVKVVLRDISAMQEILGPLVARFPAA